MQIIENAIIVKVDKLRFIVKVDKIRFIEKQMSVLAYVQVSSYRY